jgi:hypothetical protein
VSIDTLIKPTEDELRAAAIDELDEFDGEAPMLIENIDFA